MKFRNKILLSIWGVVLGLLIVTFVIINYGIRVQVEARFADELRGNNKTVNEINALRAGQDVRSCQIIAESPRLKAVAELGDRNTALQLSQELNQSTRSDLFILTNAKSQPLAQLVNGEQSEIASPRFRAITQALDRQLQADVWNIDTAVFRGASAPIMVRTDLVGTLTIGYRIRSEDVAFVKSMTNSEVILMIDKLPVVSTLLPDQESELANWLGSHSSELGGFLSRPGGEVFTIEVRSERYVATLCRLDRGDLAKSPAIAYVLLKPVQREIQAALNPVINSFIVLSVVMLLITAGIGYIISKGITRPIAELVRGTAEVSRGNYDYRMDVRTGGELKFLAQKFEEMSTSLKEKVNQLAEQNRELEDALRRLKETQEERLRLAANIRSLLESTGEGIFGLDLNGHCTLINKAAAEMIGQRSEDVIGKNMHEVTHHSHKDGSSYPIEDSPIYRVLRTGQGCRVDNEVLWRHDGTSFPVEYASYPIMDGGGIHGAVVTFTDITERKKLEEQLRQSQKLESIGSLAGGIAHDFNNILAIIMGYASLLERSAVEPARLPKSLDAINKAVQRGASLVRQLLTFARKTDILFESVNVNDTVKEIVNMLGETFPKTITFSMELEQKLPPIIGDRNQLQQALLNLCFNARDAMQNGGTLSFHTRTVVGKGLQKRFHDAQEEQYVLVSVGDTGIGMDETTRARIFEPFLRQKN